MQAMLTAFLQINTKNSAIQSVQADQMGRTYPPLFTINLPKEEEIIDDLREITMMEYVVQVIMIIVCIAIVIIIMYVCCTKCRHTRTVVLLHCGCLSLNPFIEFRIWNNSSSPDVLNVQASISISPKYESKSKTTSHCHLLLHDCTNAAV